MFLNIFLYCLKGYSETLKSPAESDMAKNSKLVKYVLQLQILVCSTSCFHQTLKVVSATFLLVYFVSLKESTCETRKNAFYFTSKALFVLEIIKF